MTDFSHARNMTCPICGIPYCDEEGYNCDCLMPRISFDFKGQTYKILEEIHEKIEEYRRDMFTGDIAPEEWVEAVEEILQDAGLVDRHRKESAIDRIIKTQYQAKAFLTQWDQAQKEIPPESIHHAYAYLVGAMGGHVPPHKIKPIIAGAVAFVKGKKN